MKKKFGYYATWNPGVPLKLGDIGTLNNNVFTRLAGLSDRGIDFEVRTDDTKTPLEHSSQGSVSVTTKLSGTVAPQGSSLANLDVGIIAELSKENSTLFKANNTTSPSIKDNIKLGEQILNLYREGKWNKNWVIITELVEAETVTVIISNNSNSKIELKANANIEAPTIDIADADFKFSTQFSKELETKIISAEELTPLFKVMGMKTRIFLPPIFKTQKVMAFDLVTPESATNKYKDEIYFGYISGEERE
ncbi:hypothetical protein [Mariniflexile sp. AS56]|uniref:hypothetical protein n=1 Tax=Mariniflexile sp. AS56 TaxID=3063957 RepID=UPI0026F1618F|nr:hypothetical protein [Mariniflexile sp. AS56]MDO7173713.1 hypothetical protein [Mariniflexile sp. AS56]